MLKYLQIFVYNITFTDVKVTVDFNETIFSCTNILFCKFAITWYIHYTSMPIYHHDSKAVEKHLYLHSLQTELWFRLTLKKEACTFLFRFILLCNATMKHQHRRAYYHRITAWQIPIHVKCIFALLNQFVNSWKYIDIWLKVGNLWHFDHEVIFKNSDW